MKKYHYIYKTTNLINGKIYIGVHSTNKLIDGYIGCGIYRQSDAFNKKKKTRFYGFAHAVSKYGYDNFKKEILYFFKSASEAYHFEAKIVNKEFINNKNTYNIKIGGEVSPCSRGIKRTQKFKIQKSKSIKKYIDKLTELHSKEYILIDTITNKKYEVKNLSKFCREFNLSVDTLRSVVDGKTSLFMNRWWACKKENWTGSIKIKVSEKKPINGILYHKNGSYITFNSLREASDLTGADKSAISKVLRGLANQTAGWSCKKW
jgi:hypothetical protein